MKIPYLPNLSRSLRDPHERARILRAFRVALSFLTIVPTRLSGGPATDADVAAARYAFPVVGLALGMALAALSAALTYGKASPLLASFLLVASWAALSGGLHLVGLANSCDGLSLGASPERRLAAMRDPHVGSLGLLALILVVLGKFAALSALSGRRRALAVLGAVAISRTLILFAAGLSPYARREGTGRTLVESTTVIDSLWAVVGALALGALLAREPGLFAGILAFLVAWQVTHLAHQKLGGITAEILGAVVELSELAYLLALALYSS